MTPLCARGGEISALRSRAQHVRATLPTYRRPQGAGAQEKYTELGSTSASPDERNGGRPGGGEEKCAHIRGDVDDASGRRRRRRKK